MCDLLLLKLKKNDKATDLSCSCKRKYMSLDHRTILKNK